jgi:fructose-specific phosphotransferase system IIC component
MRVFTGVIFGCLLFGLSVYMLFSVTHQDPHAPASISFEAGSILYGLLFALLSGHLASFIGGRPHFVAAWIVGVVVALAAIASMMRSGISWFQMATLLFMAPGVVVGGWSYVLGRKATESGNDQ